MNGLELGELPPLRLPCLKTGADAASPTKTLKTANNVLQYADKGISIHTGYVGEEQANVSPTGAVQGDTRVVSVSSRTRRRSEIGSRVGIADERTRMRERLRTQGVAPEM